MPFTRSLCLALLLGCAAEPVPLDCAHGTLEQRALLRGQEDLLILVDRASLGPEARQHVEGAVSSFVASTVRDFRVEELYAGVVISDDCEGEIGKLVPPSAECPHAGEAALTWSAAREIPPDALASALGCRAGAMVGRACDWDPAAALERAMAERDLPRTRLHVVLITTRDLESAEMLARPLSDPAGILTVVAGIRALDLGERIVDASGCEGAIDAAPAHELVAMAQALATTRSPQDVRFASICSSDWSARAAYAQTTGDALGCIPRAPIVDGDGSARCEVIERLPARSVVDRCDELPGRELVERSDPTTCRIRQGDGFVLGPPTPGLCAADAIAQLHFDVLLAAGARIDIRCQTELSDPIDCE